jgi:hypothetical protein
MSKRLMVITVAILIALTGSLLTAQTPEKAPRLTVVDPVKDFGTVAKGEKLTWAFTVKNTGTTDLEITAARPACGCTVAEFDKVIKPGASGKVVANVDTSGFTGPIAKAVTLETNDPTNPAAQVTIHAVVKPYVEAYPAGFVRYNLLQGDAEKQSVMLYSEEEEPFEITKIETPQDWIRAEVVKLEKDQLVPSVGRAGQSQYRVNVTVGGPDAKIGPIAEKIHVVTNSRHQPDYWISVTGVIRPTIRIEPTGVNFGEVSPTDTAATRSVILRSNNLKAPESFVVTKAESLAPGVKANVKATANKGEYEVTLEVAKDAKVGDIDGAVKIYTSDQIHSVVTIPIKGTVKKLSPQASK